MNIFTNFMRDKIQFRLVSMHNHIFIFSGRKLLKKRIRNFNKK
jgi:voltage-gated potassium channel Kch